MINLENALYPDLSSHRAVIVGGTGAVGEGIVRAWLKTGAHVIVPSRSEQKIEKLREVLGEIGQSDKLDFVIGSHSDFDKAQKLAEHITNQYGKVTDVVASIGGWWEGKPLWEITAEEWQYFFVNMSTTHVAVARAWIPLITKGGSYHLILGGSAIMPVAGASIINIQQAGILMMRNVLSTEIEDQLRITSQVLGPVINRTRDSFDPNWVSNDEVGLVSVGVAANSEARDEDYPAFYKDQMKENLQNLGVYPK